MITVPKAFRIQGHYQGAQQGHHHQRAAEEYLQSLKDEAVPIDAIQGAAGAAEHLSPKVQTDDRRPNGPHP